MYEASFGIIAGFGLAAASLVAAERLGLPRTLLVVFLAWAAAITGNWLRLLANSPFDKNPGFSIIFSAWLVAMLGIALHFHRHALLTRLEGVLLRMAPASRLKLPLASPRVPNKVAASLVILATAMVAYTLSVWWIVPPTAASYAQGVLPAPGWQKVLYSAIVLALVPWFGIIKPLLQMERPWRPVVLLAVLLAVPLAGVAARRAPPAYGMDGVLPALVAIWLFIRCQDKTRFDALPPPRPGSRAGLLGFGVPLAIVISTSAISWTAAANALGGQFPPVEYFLIGAAAPGVAWAFFRYWDRDHKSKDEE